MTPEGASEINPADAGGPARQPVHGQAVLPLRVRELEAELHAVRTALQEFTYSVSHDLRASLRHVTSYLQLVKEEAGAQLDGEAAEFLQIAVDAGQQLAQQIEGLTQLARLGSAPVQAGPVALPALLDDLVEAMQSQNPHRALAWERDVQVAEVHADAALLRAALRHLLDNAVKFSQGRNPARILISSCAAQSSADGSRVVILRVQDNGVGFNPAYAGKLCRPFQRLHSASQFSGLGMGLALAARMVQRLGGQLHMEGVPEQGCTATLLLPLSAG